MGTISNQFAPGAVSVRANAERLLKGIESKDFARFPSFGGKVIETNHPAFVYGHIGLYAPRMLKLMGLDPTKFVLPANYSELFSSAAKCKDDPDRTIYPDMDEIVSIYLRGADMVLAALPEVEDDTMLAVNPEEKLASRFPTIGAFLGFLLTAHVNLHLGQVSAWRRCMGLGPA